MKGEKPQHAIVQLSLDLIDMLRVQDALPETASLDIDGMVEKAIKRAGL